MGNSNNEEKNEGLNEQNQTSNDEQSIDFGDSSREIENSFNGNGSNGSEVGLMERLRNILSDERDGDLLLQGNDGENNVLQWLQALDLQRLLGLVELMRG
ncbi:hypothetical protein FRX31_011816 [Thalictrum thalictroides]|uniref:Uncharacterized protein n=1 Tax=Thalictrum thalictroides TaxID=46969 RepID=A0A7J6WQ51_THATH|nr:hypothetical protein FRX31_011816 [Thalictrum thalictroides]